MKSEKTPELPRIHFVGICGVGMSAIAIALKKRGYRVTGSDKGFYPPVSNNLKRANIHFYPGWHPNKMTANEDPDLVVVGNAAGSRNPEWIYAKEKNIPCKSYPEIIAEFFVKKNSIICAGTYGKTTSSAILSWILKENNFDPAYMFGGVPMNNMPPAELTDSEYSILEGDEYKSASWDDRPKFAHYSPTHLLLTSVVWDHADIYPTEKSYAGAFKELIRSLPNNATLVVSEKVPKKIYESESHRLRVTNYGTEDIHDYAYKNIQTSKNGIEFQIKHGSSIFDLQSSALGDYMADNITGCFAMARELGIEPKKIIASLASFKNIKRRLEKRSEGNITIFDDIAHSPQKAQAVLKSLRGVYAGKIIAVFEPNTGNRKKEAEAGYDHAFDAADQVIIPRLTAVKTDPHDPNPPFEGAYLRDIIAKTHDSVVYIEDDITLVETILRQSKKADCIVFLGSHGFRGMIEALVDRLR